MKKFTIVIFAIVILLFAACAKEDTSQPVERKFDSTSVDADDMKDIVFDQSMGEDEDEYLAEQGKEAKKETEEIKKEAVKTPVKKDFISKVTAFAKGDDGKYSITINDRIKILGITIVNGKAIMPSNEWNGKKYYFVWANDPGFLAMIADAIINKSISTASTTEITKVDVRVKDSGTLKGYGEIEINGEFLIKSIPVFIGGRYGDGIGDPAIKVDGEWAPMVKFTDKGFKKTVKEMVLEKYCCLSS